MNLSIFYIFFIFGNCVLGENLGIVKSIETSMGYTDFQTHVIVITTLNKIITCQEVKTSSLRVDAFLHIAILSFSNRLNVTSNGMCSLRTFRN